jgi:hypothetical protein
MTDNRGEIQKRLDDNMCPWCMALLHLAQEEYKDGERILTRKCSSCSGTVVDTFKHKGDANGDDTRSQG